MWPGVLKESLSEDVLALAAFHVAPARLPAGWRCRGLALPSPPTALISGMADLANRSITGRKIPFPPAPKIHTRCEPLEAAFLFLTVSPAQ